MLVSLGDRVLVAKGHDDPDRAAEALRRLAAGRMAQLETLPLPLRLREDGTLDTRSALDVLAGHLEVLGRSREAAEMLLAGRLPGTVAAERLERAVTLLVAVPLDPSEAPIGATPLGHGSGR